ncbi:amidase [Thermodesulfobacteriota bacterium]
MKSLPLFSATKLISLIRRKKISSVELLNLCKNRYDRLNPRINAIVYTDFENALKRARQADEALARGRSWGPLHGLPMTVKDSFEVTGMPCTSGSPDLKDYVPTINAKVVEELLNAGAIVFGKTNVPLFTMDVQSFNKVYGQTNNPWDFSKVPGGSSGGAAAALSAGLTGLEIGSDIGGSIRNPSHFCGTYGHKPTFNIVPRLGHIPPQPGIFPGEYFLDGDIAVVGPMARSAEDLELVLRLIIKSKPFQRIATLIKLPPPRKNNLKDFRIGLWLDDPAFPVDSVVGDCLQAAVDRLSSAGAKISDKQPDVDFAHCYDIYAKLLHATTSMELSDEDFERIRAKSLKLDKNDESSKALQARGISLSHRDWMKLDYQRLLMRQKWAEFFKDFDVLLSPVFPITAFPHDHSELMDRVLRVNGQDRDYEKTAISWAGLTGVSYLPATVAPTGLAKNGLPVGIQIVGPYLEDFTTLRFAKLIKGIVGEFVPPPGFE